MKKGILLFLCFLLTGCGFVPSITGKESNLALINAFEYDKKCPFICWLGINPGTTTAAQALAFVNTSNQFDPKSTDLFNNHIYTIWSPGKSTSTSCKVNIRSVKGLIESMDFNCSPPVTVEDLVNFLGKPDEIISDGYFVDECALFTYSIYYDLQKTLIRVSTCIQFTDRRNISWNGPDPKDSMDFIVLHFDDTTYLADLGVRKHWQGYGQPDYYLPGGIRFPPTDVPPPP